MGKPSEETEGWRWRRAGSDACQRYERAGACVFVTFYLVGWELMRVLSRMEALRAGRDVYRNVTLAKMGGEANKHARRRGCFLFIFSICCWEFSLD